MSTDQKITTDLIETLEDGKDGFAQAANRLADTEQPELAGRFREFSDQRGKFAAELQTIAARYGDDLDRDGSMAAAAHRTWMSVKDTLTGADPHSILETAEQGEDRAVDQYEEALNSDISSELRMVVQRQFTSVKQTHDAVRQLRDAHA